MRWDSEPSRPRFARNDRCGSLPGVVRKQMNCRACPGYPVATSPECDLPRLRSPKRLFLEQLGYVWDRLAAPSSGGPRDQASVRSVVSL